MSNQTPSQGSPYEEEPLDKYDEAFNDLLSQLGDIGVGVGSFPVSDWEDVDDENITYEEIDELYSQSPEDVDDEVSQWNELLDIANEPDPGPSMSDMLWEAERKKAEYPMGKGFRMKMTDTDEWLKKNKRVSE